MDTSKITIESERLLLVPVDLKYKKNIFREFTPEITKYMKTKSPVIIGETIAFIKRALEKNKNGLGFTAIITLKETGEYLGGCGIHEIKTISPTIGIWIKRSAHGKSYGKETVFALVKWARENLHFEYIEYSAVNLNTKSRRIPESLGATIFEECNFENGYSEKFKLVKYKILK